MKCLECNSEPLKLDNEHLLCCCGLTLQEYAIKHHFPLDILVSQDQINWTESVHDYAAMTVPPDRQALNCLTGLQLAGMLQEANDFYVVSGEIKYLDLLLWELQWLRPLGFQFRQEYAYHQNTHRVVARNRLKAPRANLQGLIRSLPVESSDFLDSLAVAIAHAGELHAGYLFVVISHDTLSDLLIGRLFDQYRLTFKVLASIDSSSRVLLRSDTQKDADRLLGLLKDRMLRMPGMEERFFTPLPEATVVKALEFDSAHFITDHPGKCSNLHGGRYVIHVKVKDRIDPATGFVLDYGYLKKVVKNCVIEKLDHQNLNYVSGALAWRSSTELLSIYIWEQLIEYLPGLKELEIHETARSYCCYSGPSLAEFQKHGRNPLLKHFSNPRLGKSTLRQQLVKDSSRHLKIVKHRSGSKLSDHS